MGLGARVGPVGQAEQKVMWFSPSSQRIFTTFLSSFVSARTVWGASSCLQVSPRACAWGHPGLGCVRVSPIATLEGELGTEGYSIRGVLTLGVGV